MWDEEMPCLVRVSCWAVFACWDSDVVRKIQK
jgi:hypothetical protein